MNCPKCGIRNPDSSKYCSNCGGELPDYSVDNTGGYAVGLSVFMTVLFTVLAIITKNVANHSSATISNIYILGRYVGRSSWREIYNIAFGFCVFCAIFMFILIFIAIGKKSDAEAKNRALMVKMCPDCHESISNGATECPHCGHSFITEPDFWICPRCRRKNYNNVGTCGCGEVKP